MDKTLEQLLSLSSIIANETKAGANTALRVGGLFSDIIYYLRDLDYADKDDIPSLEGYATEQWVLGKGYATTTDLDARIDALVNGAPAAYDTLKEIADVLAGNVNSISDILTALGNKADKATTLSGYGITDAYTITQIDSIVNGLSGNISTLQGYFTDGVANSALKLSDNGSYTAWGQTFFTNGKPKSVSGALTDVTDITSSGTITTNKIVIGNGTIEWDDTNKGFKVTGLYSTTYLSAKGANTNGGSTPSGNQYTRLDTWDGYTSAMDGWVLSAKLGKGLYDTQNSLISRVGALEGKATNVSFTQSLTSGTQIGSISIDGVTKNIYAPTIPTSDINKGVTAHGWGNHASAGYQPLITSTNKLAYSLISGVPTKLSQFTNDLGLGTFAYKSSLAFADLTGKPTTIGGYGITDAYTKSQVDSALGGYLPLSGGTINGNLTVGNSTGVLGIKNTSSNSLAYLIYQGDTNWRITDNGWGTSYGIIHSGNIGSQSVASAAKLTTARTIWGQSFDGTGNVSGAAMGLGGAIDFQFTDEINRYGGNLYLQHRGDGSQTGTGTGATGNVVMCKNGGNVLIGTSTDSGYKLDVNGDICSNKSYRLSNSTFGGLFSNNIITSSGDASDIWLYNANKLILYGSSVDIRSALNCSSTIHATTGIWSDGYVSAKGQNTSSDMRLKNVLNDVMLNVSDIANAPSMRFSWKNGGGVDVGSSAQYWQRLLPDAVKERDGMLEMQYANIALLSVIALAKNFETMDERVARLEKENKELRNEINSLRYGA